MRVLCVCFLNLPTHTMDHERVVPMDSACNTGMILNFYNLTKKCFIQKLWCHLLALNATNYSVHLNTKIWIPTESAQRECDIAIRDFN